MKSKNLCAFFQDFLKLQFNISHSYTEILNNYVDIVLHLKQGWPKMWGKNSNFLSSLFFSGPGDGFFSSAFQSTLKGNVLYKNTVPAGLFMSILLLFGFFFRLMLLLSSLILFHLSV